MIRNIIVGLTLVAFVGFSSRYIYFEHVVTRLPLQWQTFDADSVEQLVSPDNPILVLIQDSSIRNGPNRVYYFEYDAENNPNKRLRKFIVQNRVGLYKIELDELYRGKERAFDEVAARKIDELLHIQFPHFGGDVSLLPSIVIAIPGKKDLLCFDSYLDSDELMEILASSGSDVSKKMFSGAKKGKRK